tara:strand:+ start:63 stop:494 length:432 start_codon:yes stop_codon:yes gene_type:complete
MKKQSGFKMKGFSGFGNSPVKQDLLNTKIKDIPGKVKKSVKKLGDKTVKDVIKMTPPGQTYQRVQKLLNLFRSPKINITNLPMGGIEAVSERLGTMTRTKTKPDKPAKGLEPEIKIKKMKVLPVKPMPKIKQKRFDKVTKTFR